MKVGRKAWRRQAGELYEGELREGVLESLETAGWMARRRHAGGL
jgi:hypothetical protein